MPILRLMAIIACPALRSGGRHWRMRVLAQAWHRAGRSLVGVAWPGAGRGGRPGQRTWVRV